MMPGPHAPGRPRRFSVRMEQLPAWAAMELESAAETTPDEAGISLGEALVAFTDPALTEEIQTAWAAWVGAGRPRAKWPFPDVSTVSAWLTKGYVFPPPLQRLYDAFRARDQALVARLIAGELIVSVCVDRIRWTWQQLPRQAWSTLKLGRRLLPGAGDICSGRTPWLSVPRHWETHLVSDGQGHPLGYVQTYEGEVMGRHGLVRLCPENWETEPCLIWDGPGRPDCGAIVRVRNAASIAAPHHVAVASQTAASGPGQLSETPPKPKVVPFKSVSDKEMVEHMLKVAREDFLSVGSVPKKDQLFDIAQKAKPSLGRDRFRAMVWPLYREQAKAAGIPVFKQGHTKKVLEEAAAVAKAALDQGRPESDGRA